MVIIKNDYVYVEYLCFLSYAFQWNALYVENMLRVESSAFREIIGSRILMAVVDMLIEN